MFLDRQVLDILAALAVGLLIGIERGWKLRDRGDGTRVAGVRTFTLLGLLGGMAGVLASAGFAASSAIVLGGCVTITIIGYYRVAQDGRLDSTTGVAAIATLALAFTAGIGAAELAVAGAAVVTCLLALRAELHRWVGALDAADLKALARYAVIAFAVFPFLPEGRYGPYDAWDPRSLWLVVVIVTGFSFAGYVANRIFGARRGAVATAIIGGAYSSTAVTMSFAQRLGRGAGGAAEIAGIALATEVMYLRVIILVAVLANALLIPFMMVVAPALLVGGIVSFALYRRADAGGEPQSPGNPIALLPALSFVAFVAAAAVAARWAQGRFGEQGIAVLLFLMGSMDVDAAIVTAGGLKPGTIAPDLAALAIGGTIMANMALKLGITLTYGREPARPAAFALAASMATLAVTLGIGWFRL